MTDAYQLDARRVRRSFDRASDTYDEVAVLQRTVREQLLERLDLVALSPSGVLDAGCGTGHGTAALMARYPRARVIALDLAPGMLHHARRRGRWLRRPRAVCADAARLPLPDESVELVFSNLMLQWCNDPDAVFAEFRRVAAPGGLLTFTTFGPDTLKELRAAWSAADGYSHVNRFIDMHDLGDGLVRAGFAEPVMDIERFTLTYGNLRGLMNDLKAMGAHNVTHGRSRGLTGRRRLAAAVAAYETFRADGRLPATWEVVYGHAWVPDGAPGRAPVKEGEVRIPAGGIPVRQGGPR